MPGRRFSSGGSFYYNNLTDPFGLDPNMVQPFLVPASNGVRNDDKTINFENVPYEQFSYYGKNVLFYTYFNLSLSHTHTHTIGYAISSGRFLNTTLKSKLHFWQH